MATTVETAAFERGVRPLAEQFFPEKADSVLNFHPPAELQARIEELAAKSTEGTLSNGEREEYEGYVRANKFIAILKRLARDIRGKAACDGRADPNACPGAGA